jgi:thymidylate kinase
MTESPTLIALNGVHTAGKSTLGEMLEEDLGVNYYSEVAQKLIDEEGADWGDEGDYAFQKAIHEKETSRDIQDILSNQEHAVIETWHFGNLAHSKETAPSLVEEQEEYVNVLEEHTDAGIYIVFLDMPLERIWNRSPHFEEGNEEILEFYDDVRDNHFELYEEHNVEYIVVENDGGLDDAYEEVRRFTQQVLDE